MWTKHKDSIMVNFIVSTETCLHKGKSSIVLTYKYHVQGALKCCLMRTACCSSLKATFVTSFTMQATPHFTGNIRQDCPPIFNLKALGRHPHKHGRPHSTYYTITHMENYHEYSILLKVIKALHYLANIYSALIMREQKNETHMGCTLKAIMSLQDAETSSS